MIVFVSICLGVGDWLAARLGSSLLGGCLLDCLSSQIRMLLSIDDLGLHFVVDDDV